MKKNKKDEYNKDFTDKPIQSDQEEISYLQDWRNEHGQPDFKYLHSLATDGSIEALEKLKSIANDLDVDFDPNGSTVDLVDKIRVMTEQDGDGGIQPTT
jgi:hypothetical protein